MNRITKTILAVVVLTVIAGSSFYGGMLFGQSRTQSSRTSGNRLTGGPGGYFQGQGQNGQGQGFPGGGGGLFGQVVEVGDGYLTVEDNNGTQTKVQVTNTTLIEKNASVQLGSIAKGETVMISGSQGTDGTLTARSIQVAPAGRFGAAPNGANP